MLNNILQYLDATARRVPDKTAFSDGRVALSFRELDGASRRIGTALCRLGYGREPVAVLMQRAPAEIAAFLGVVRAGCFYAALDEAMPAARMEQILHTLSPRLLICDRHNRPRADALVASGALAGCVLSYEELCLEEPDEAVLAAVRDAAVDQDPIYVVFTSGSTGVPKGVAACHRSVLDYTESLCEAIGFSEDTVFANQTPLYFDAPLKEIMPTLKYGATTYLVPKMLFSFPIPLCDFLNQHKVNTVCWVVSALTMISAFGVLDSHPPRYLTTVCFGSEVFPRPQYDRWRAALPEARFFNLYGPTEATGMSCWWHADRALAPDEPIPVGHPFRNTDILLLAEGTHGARRITPDEPDTEGEICMRGTCVTLGYYNDPARTAAAFVQNPLQSAYPEIIYRTGDIGRYNAHGELVFVGRRDAQIKILGHRVELGEIEAAAAPAVRAACCVYDGARTRLVLYYTADESVTPDGLRAMLNQRLPRYMMPALLIRLDALPLTPNGKIDRRALTEAAKATD